ncbi:hypothetical protein [Pseudidiomarina homiensis]|uniref:hypothetical protein n=1 Tax=Pseudidiomarina homiensis TaxID=364198 RepID=UPI00215A5400|nr:hypothetical protein [Pseudidiomarina homiensis]
MTQHGDRYQQPTFFFRLALLITVVVFSGFILNWLINPNQLERVTVWIGVHGAFSAAWYLLLLNQSYLVRARQFSRHRLWGKLSVILVIAILLTGVIMTLDLYERLVNFGVFNPEDANARVRAGALIGSTFLQWTLFACLYILGLFNIGSPAHHKRFMLAAAVQLMPEGLNRLIHVLTLPGYMMLVIIACVYASIVIYDLKTTRRIQSSTMISIALFALLATSIYTVFQTQVWGDWVVNML